MSLLTIQQHESKSIASSQVATINIPKGGKIYNLFVRFATGANADATVAAIKSEISNIRLTLNGRDIVNASPTKLFDIYTFLGQNINDTAGVAGILELNLAPFLYTDPAAREILGLGTADVDSIIVSVTAGTLSTIASVQGFTSRSQSNENLGVYGKVINYPVSFNSTGVHTYDTLPKDADTAYTALLVDAGASGTLTFSELRTQSLSLRDLAPRSIASAFLSGQRYSNVAGYYTHLFANGSLDTLLPMVGVSDFRIFNTFSVAPGAAGYNVTALSVVNLVAALNARRG
jgi:hypothetical protein